MGSAFDFQTSILDEIALEGLEGITLEMLWQRLADRPDFTIALDDDSKNFFWDNIAKHRDIEIYQLPVPRISLPIFNRYDHIDTELGVCIEPLEPVHDPYKPIAQVNDGLVRGSCSSYKSRKCVTSYIRCGNEVLLMSLDQVVARWGKSLVLVASPKLRLLALIGTETNPLVEFTTEAYCLLERIGRSRYIGEVTQGEGGLLSLRAPFCKQIHYYRKKLSSKGLITKQNHYVKLKSGQTSTGCLFHLTRFYVHRKTKMANLVKRLCDILKDKPINRESAIVLRGELGVKEATFKKLSYKPFHKWLKFMTMTYRDFNPNGTKAEWFTQTGHEKVLRVVQMIKHCDESEDCDEEEEEEEEIEGKEKVLPMNVHHDFTKVNPKIPLIAQVYDYVHASGPEGISAADLGRALTLPRLDIRGLLKALAKHDYIVTFLQDRGRQKVTKYIAKAFEGQNMAYSALKEILEQETKVDQLVNGHDDSSNKRTADEELENVAPQKKKAKVDVKVDDNILQVDDADVISQVLGVRSQSNQSEIESNQPKLINISDKLLIEPKPRKLTLRIIKRTKMILDHLKAERVSNIGELQKYITEKEKEEGYAFKLDKKSIKRLLNHLYFNGRIRIFIAEIAVDEVNTSMEFVCEKTLEKTDPRIQVYIEQAKFKHFAITKEGTQKVEANGNKKIEAKDHKKTDKKINSGAPPKGKPERAPNKSSIIKEKATKKPLIESVQTVPKLEILHKLPRMTPKYMRAKSLHMFLHYLVYQHKAELKTGNEQYVYHESMSWKRYVPPLPDYSKKGWCFLADVFPRMPLSLFLKIINVRQGVSGLNSYLENEDKANYLIKFLPQQLRNSLLSNRKYMFSTNDVVKVLCYMGLITMGPQVGKQKDQVFLFVHNKASLKDTTVSPPGYIHVRNDIEYETRNFLFQGEDDVANFWLDLENVCFHTPLGKYTAAAGKTIAIAQASFKPELMTALKSKGFDEIEEKFDIPGDGLGAAGFDSAMFMHSRRNWQSPVCGYKPPQASTKGKTSPTLKPMQHLLKVSDTNKPETRSRLQRITKNSLLLQKENKVKKITTEKSAVFPKVLPPKKRNRVILRTIKLRSNANKRKNFYDEKDKAAMKKMDKIRCDWSPQEDSFLLLCKVASTFLDPLHVRNLVVPYTVVRDLLHEYVAGPSFDKSSRACQRRMRYMMLNPTTINNVKVFLGEALQDKQLVSEFNKPKPPKTKELIWRTMFTNITNKLLVKFTLPISDRCKNTVIPSSLVEFDKKFEILADQNVIERSVRYRIPQTIEDVKKHVLRTFILSAMAVENDGRKWSLLLHKVYQTYPEGYLQSVVTQLRKEKIIAIKKKTSRIDQRHHHTTGPFKFSITYNNSQLTKFPVKIYKEAKELLDNLKLLNSETNVELKGDVPAGYAASVLALVTMEQLVIHTQIPDQIILFDSSLSKEARSNIVERMIHTLSDKESMELTRILNEENQSETNPNKGSTECHSAVVHNSEMTAVDDSFADTNMECDSQIQRMNASRFALYLLRHEMSQPPIERVQHSHDYIVLNACRVFCQLKPFNTPPLPVNPLDVIEKTPDWQKTTESEYITKDKMELNIDRISEILKFLTTYIPAKALTTNRNYDDSIELLYDQYSPQTVHDAKCIFNCIYEANGKGISKQEIWSMFVHLAGELDIFEHLQVLCRESIIVRAGITEFTYVCSCFAINWVVVSFPLSDFNQETSNKKLNSQENSEGAVMCTSCEIDKKQCNDIINNTVITIQNPLQPGNQYFLPRTWRNPDGTLNTTTFFELLTTVLSHVISSPGLSPVQLCEQLSLVLPPVQIFELIEVLEQACCVYRYYCKPLKKTSLFSAPRTIYITENPQPGDLEHIEPFPDAVCKITQLKNAMQ